MSSKIRSAFEPVPRLLPLASILPIRQPTAADNAFGKLNKIRTSIKEVGLVEPLVVYPQRGVADKFILLDGHLRLVVLREAGAKEVLCLVATEEDAFTYNDKTNYLNAIQEHAMIKRAIAQGVTPEQIARALGAETAKVKAGLNLLEGIHQEAIELLKDKPISSAALRLLKKVKAVRQIDMAHLMVSGNPQRLAHIGRVHHTHNTRRPFDLRDSADRHASGEVCQLNIRIHYAIWHCRKQIPRAIYRSPKYSGTAPGSIQPARFRCGD